MLKSRLIGGVIVTIVYIIFALLGGIPLLLACLALGLGAMYEMYGVADVRQNKLTYIGYISLLVIYYTVWKGADYRIEMAVVLVALTIFVIFHSRINISRGYIIFSAIIYPGLLTASIYLIREIDIYYMVLLIVSSWCTDVGAYFSGKALGKHHIFSILSPKKTAEGCIGGILTAVILSIVAALLFKKSIGSAVIICLIGSICSEIGDLVASAIKRKFNKKDYGNIIPGHGGLLDRFDSMIFTSAVIYCLSVFF